MLSKKTFIFSILTSLSILFSINNGYAELSTVTTYLLKEPISVMDWGVNELNNYITERFYNNKEEIDISELVGVNYDVDQNKIIIDGMNLHVNPPTKEEANKFGKEFILKIKKIMRINLSTEKKLPGPTVFELYDILFSHPAKYTTKNIPQNIGLELAKLTVVKYSVFLSDGSEIKCKSLLLDSDIYCSEP